VDRFTSNEDQNDQRLILHVSSNAFHGWKRFAFVIFVCNHLGTSHVTAATWPGTYLWDETSRCRKSTSTKQVIKNSNHSYVRNVLRIELVKLQSIWKSGYSRICHTKTKSGKIWLRLDWKKKFATVLVFFWAPNMPQLLLKLCGSAPDSTGLHRS